MGLGREIGITGLGVMSAIGEGWRSYWDTLLTGTSGFRPITLFDASRYPVALAAEMSGFDPLAHLDKKGLRELDRSTRLLCAAARLALDDSGLTVTPDAADRIGISVGATFGSLHSISEFDRVGLTEGPRCVNPSFFANTVINAPASRAAIRFGLRGINGTLSSGFCAGLDSIMYATDFLRLGRGRAILAGGTEELCEETFMAFLLLGHLAGTDGGPAVSCPYDSRHNGFMVGEGAALVMLEDMDHARARNASVMARVLGYATALDSTPGFVGAGDGLAAAIRRALADARTAPDQIGWVASCANSHPDLDRKEASALREVFGDQLSRLPVSAIKSMIGETYSAAGALAICAAAASLQTGLIPPTAGFTHADPLCELDIVHAGPRRMDGSAVLVTASDPHGFNSAVVLGRAEA